jgi:hypothetical protein
VATANQRHVVHSPGGGWAVKKPNSLRASSRHSTQAQAQERAKEILSHSGGGEAITHTRDGRIRQSDTVEQQLAVDWSLLSPQGQVLFYIALCPDSTMKGIARAIGHTERQIWSIIRSLRHAGMLRLRRDGRRHHYSIDLDAPLTLANIEGITLRPIMGRLAEQARSRIPDICQEADASAQSPE